MTTMSRLALSLLLLAVAARAQQAAVQRLDAVDHQERLKRIALVGDHGLPPLLPLLPDSPLDTMYFADRQPVVQDTSSYAATEGGPGQMFDGLLPPGPGGTGTDKPEPFKYQVPGNYDSSGPPVPMVIAYHGFGSSPLSVVLQTTIDEEANARGWFFMAPTGIDDILFGSPVCQQNVEAAIQWVLDNYNIDEDRLYMVGFSMGGGVCTNFIARRRDPDGMMIAALGIVSGSFDWTQSWHIGDTVGKDLLEHEYNFGGTPAQFPYAYKRSSGLYFEVGTYTPLPGTLDSTQSMARNLGSTPTYVTWDIADSLPEVLAQQPVFVGFVGGLGGTLVSKPVSGTPAPKHSWLVLNEVELFNFFDGKVVDRTPDIFEALVDGSKQTSWAEVVQINDQAFSRVSGVAVPAARTVSASNVQNASQLSVQVDQAGMTGPADVHVAAASGTGQGFKLQINDAAAPPAWLEDFATGALLPGTESDPFAEGLITHVTPSGLTVDLVTQADYIADLSTSPEPAPINASVTLSIDAPSSANMVFVVLGFSQSLSTFKGSHKLLVSLLPSTMVIGLPLGPGGVLEVQGDIPNDPALSGMEILFQGIMAAGSQVDSLSNLWRMDIG